MIHPWTELKFISPEIGYGVVATRLIPQGTITWVMDRLDQVFTPEDVAGMEPVYQAILDTYTFRDPQGNFVLCWDLARYVNHSFSPTCITTAYDFELAVRDILPGEQLTDDYGFLNITEPFDCVPEPGTTRTRVYPDDLLGYHEAWDQQLLEAFRHFDKVLQPLRLMVSPDHLEKADAIVRGEATMDSILNCYFDSNR